MSGWVCAHVCVRVSASECVCTTCKNVPIYNVALMVKGLEAPVLDKQTKY